MKYGILIVECLKQGATNQAVLNIGNIAMALSLENLLCEIGVNKQDIIYINDREIRGYEGDYLVLLVSVHMVNDAGNKNIFEFPPRIIPVFLSIALNNFEISDEQAERLRLYAPIGCRDDHTMHALREKNIDAFVLGCFTLTFDKREILPSQTKVFFVDAPYGILKYIPEEIKKDIVFIEHELNIDNIPDGMTSREYTDFIIEKYKTQARLVVTSKFHSSIFAIALGIPVILVNETYTLRFSSLRNLIPYYTREKFPHIDWNPVAIDIEPIKIRMKNIAKKRIRETVEKYSEICEQSALLEYSDWESAGLIDYYDEAIEFIENKWSKNDEIQYAIWGFNNNAKEIIEYLNSNYPNAKLVEIYDTYKEIKFKNLISVTPEKINSEKKLFIFVTTFVAGYFAEQIFKEKNITPTYYFICRRRYIRNEDLNKEKGETN